RKVADGDKPTRSDSSTLEILPSRLSTCNILSSNLSMMMFHCLFSF
ncbi:hypothetical protein D046_2463, partial [Vibrio parahaemolyticus V-223/04]